jgi:homoserine kinase
LFGAALGDLLHEPYRAAADPRLGAIRTDLPPGALGATISGSGPSLIVWARAESVSACAAELAHRYPEVEVSVLAVSPRGAHSF